jgi:hypothetical protein
MSNLSENEIFERIFQKWEDRIGQIAEEVDASLTGKVDGKEKIILSPGTKMRHKKSKLLYTLMRVEANDVVLLAPEGDKEFLVNKDTLEKEYAID